MHQTRQRGADGEGGGLTGIKKKEASSPLYFAHRLYRGDESALLLRRLPSDTAPESGFKMDCR